jgi:hypothetical protein
MAVASGRTRWRVPRVLGGLVTLLSLSAVAGILGPVQSAEAVTPPPLDWSFYVAPWDTPSTAWQLGYNQANYDGSVNYSSLVILDFGVQTADGSGTRSVVDNSTVWSYGADEFYAANFALGYQQGNHGYHTLTLAIGTNNSYNDDGGGACTEGQAWGNAVNAVAANASQSGYANVSVWGAGDWETWGTFGYLEGWAGCGYSTVSNSPVINFGSADGCPSGSYSTWQNYPCSGDWNQDSNWWDSWGWGPAWATPEIYYNGPTQNCPGFQAQHIAWADIDQWGSNDHNSPISFLGPFTDANTCDPTNDAYIDFWNALGAVGMPEYQPYLPQDHTS